MNQDPHNANRDLVLALAWTAAALQAIVRAHSIHEGNAIVIDDMRRTIGEILDDANRVLASINATNT